MGIQLRVVPGASFTLMASVNTLVRHGEISDQELRRQIRKRQIALGGNARLKIYGKLNCRSGKRMKKANRVFFHSREEAIQNGFRPCGHCLAGDYKKWIVDLHKGRMDLFSSEPTNSSNVTGNLLPQDGVVHYYGQVMTPKMAGDYFDRLLQTIEWKNDEAHFFGKHIITKRKAAWYGDAGYLYTYSNTTKQALPWTRELLELKQLAQELTGLTFNSCLLNLYHTGQEGMAWHSDDEKALGKNTAIASFSFGAERKFSFKHKQTKQALSLVLENGSLLVMQGATQTNWLHRLPPTRKISQPRINLTFRTIVV